MGARSSKNNNPSATNIDGHLVEYFRNSLKTRDFGTIVGPEPTTPLGMTATGGVISDYTDPGPGAVYRAHVFTSSGVFDVTELSSSLPNNVEYVVIAGGGGAGCDAYAPADRGAGGGGAGGIHSNHPDMPSPRRGAAFPVSAQSYPVVIGGGGIGAYSDGGKGNNGTDSVFSSITSTGGGAGGGHTSGMVNGNPGGSGGGATNDQSGLGVVSPSNQGFPGGNGATGGSYGGGGGGGAGGAGTPAPNSYGGNGGPGIQIKIAGPTTHTGTGALNPGPGEYQWFAGGGAGYGSNATGGVGGGANSQGFSPDPLTVLSGQSGTGGGGAGTRQGKGAGSGGSGIVIARYQIGRVAGHKASGGKVSYFNDKTIHTFTNSGTFTTPGSFNETVEYLAVGGGGGGGTQHAGGGGAGGLTTASVPLNAGGTPINAAIVIGAGAQGLVQQVSTSGTPGDGHSGNNTTVAFPSPVTAGAGGGGGSLWASAPPYGEGASMPLGSGGGGGMNQPPSSGVPDNEGTGGPQGNPGGRGWYHETYAGIGGGGGGAGSCLLYTSDAADD